MNLPLELMAKMDTKERAVERMGKEIKTVLVGGIFSWESRKRRDRDHQRSCHRDGTVRSCADQHRDRNRDDARLEQQRQFGDAEEGDRTRLTPKD